MRRSSVVHNKLLLGMSGNFSMPCKKSLEYKGHWKRTNLPTPYKGQSKSSLLYTPYIIGQLTKGCMGPKHVHLEVSCVVILRYPVCSQSGTGGYSSAGLNMWNHSDSWSSWSGNVAGTHHSAVLWRHCLHKIIGLYVVTCIVGIPILFPGLLPEWCPNSSGQLQPHHQPLPHCLQSAIHHQQHQSCTLTLSNNIMVMYKCYSHVYMPIRTLYIAYIETHNFI